MPYRMKESKKLSIHYWVKFSHTLQSRKRSGDRVKRDKNFKDIKKDIKEYQEEKKNVRVSLKENKEDKKDKEDDDLDLMKTLIGI